MHAIVFSATDLGAHFTIDSTISRSTNLKFATCFYVLYLGLGVIFFMLFFLCFVFSFILGGYCDYWIQLYVLVVPLAQVSSIFNWRANNSFSSQTKLRARRARLDDGRDGPSLARLGPSWPDPPHADRSM